MVNRVILISFPWKSIAVSKFISNLLIILDSISEEVLVITSNTDRISYSTNKIRLIDVKTSMHYSKDYNSLPFSYTLWLFKCIVVQFKQAFFLIKYGNSDDIVIFYLAYPYHLLPLIACKITGKKTIEVITRSRPSKQPIGYQWIIEKITFLAPDGISFESNALKKNFSVPKSKELPEGARFIDLEEYRLLKPQSERLDKIGYIGRIVPEKGVLSFINAIPLIAKVTKVKCFFVGGTGHALPEVKRICDDIEKNNDISIEIAGFIQEEKLPSILNELKFLILPTTHMEGLPTIVLEAMACGTIVITTPAGAITSVIEDGINGFLLSGVDSTSIVDCINTAYASNLNTISSAAQKTIFDRFSKEHAIDRWRRIVEKISNNHLG